MNSLLRGMCLFVIVNRMLYASVAAAADSVDVERVPDFIEQVTITGEQAEALTVAIRELEKENLALSKYQITVYQAEDVILFIFGSPGKRLSDRSDDGSGPPGFEVTVSRRSMHVLKSHFTR